MALKIRRILLLFVGVPSSVQTLNLGLYIWILILIFLSVLVSYAFLIGLWFLLANQ
jgi:hypothetical protein